MSGTGKTALVEQLRLESYPCFPEPARQILEAHLPEEGDGFAASFIELMLKQSLSDFHAAPSGISFYDRGLPDTAAYAIRFGVDPEPCMMAAESLRYETQVFVAPPWPDIFVHDEYRRAPYDDYVQFHKRLLETYQLLGYTLVELPKDSVSKRVKFVQSRIEGGT